MSKCYFLYNPMAGNGKAAERAAELAKKQTDAILCDMTAVGGYA